MRSVLFTEPTPFGFTLVALVNYVTCLLNGWEINLTIAVICLYFRIVIIKTRREICTTP